MAEPAAKDLERAARIEIALSRGGSLIVEVSQALADEREHAAKIAESPYGDAVEAYGNDEPLAVGAKIAAAIRAGGTHEQR